MSRFSPAVGVVMAVVTVAIWTGFIVVGRASVAHTLLPFDLALLRIVGAGVVLLPLGLWLTRTGGAAHDSGSLAGFSPLPLTQTVLTGLAGGLVYSILCYAGFFFAPAAHAAVLLPGTQPLWAALLALVILRERLTSGRVLGIACIIAGGVLVGGPSLRAALDGGQMWKGDAIFLLAAMCWAMYGVLARRFQVDPLRSTIAITVFACFTYVPLFVLMTASGLLPTHLGQAPWGEILAQALFQGVCVVAVAGVTFVTMVQVFGPVRAAMITALVPGLSALGAVLLLGEPLGWNLIGGLVLVTAGILFGVQPPRRRVAGAVAACPPA